MLVNVQMKKVARIEKDIEKGDGSTDGSVFLRLTFENGYELKIPIEHADYVGITFEENNDDEDPKPCDPVKA